MQRLYSTAVYHRHDEVSCTTQQRNHFTFGSFTFRLLAGIVFGVLFKLRGFAVAVYTHAFYDIFVLVIR